MACTDRLSFTPDDAVIDHHYYNVLEARIAGNNVARPDAGWTEASSQRLYVWS
jgi:hypothetical protein